MSYNIDWRNSNSKIKKNPETGFIDLNQNDLQRFSLQRIVRALVTGNTQESGFEYEVTRACEKSLGRTTGGFIVPWQVLERRGLTKVSSSAGGYLVGTDHLGGSFIEILRNKMLIQLLGATVLSGLVGDVVIPRQDSPTAAYWVTEGNSPTEGAPTFGQVTMSPKTVAGYVDITRKLALQSSPSIEYLIQSDLTEVLGLAIDRAAICGSSSSNEPTGILNTTGIGSVTTSGSVTWDNVVDLETKVSENNADIGSLGYLCHPITKSYLKQARYNQTYGDIPLWTSGKDSRAEGMLNGYPAYSTNQVPVDISGDKTALIFGNFSDLILGLWGPGIEINIDRSTLSLSGGRRIVAFCDCDIALRHAKSFAAAKDISTS